MYYLKVKKSNGKLLFKDGGSWGSRNKSTIWLLIKADAIYKWPDFPEIIINTGDVGINSIHSYSQMNSYENVVPEFSFHAWPEVRMFSYTDTIHDIDKCGLAPYQINKVGWIGNLETNRMRKVLYDIGQAHADIFDICDMTWKNNADIMNFPNKLTILNPSSYMSLPELVSKYSILIDIEGVGYSARLKYLLWSHRPVIIVDRPHKEYFFEHLKEWEHYIPVKRDLSDLVEQTQWIMNNYDKALEIAEKAYEFAKVHLTREACYAQWDKVIRKVIENA